MIRSVTVVNHLGEEMVMELTRPEKSGFAIQEIRGIGPSKADINTSGNATGDGSFYNSARVQQRNVVFDLIFISNDIESVRQKSYQFFPIKRRIKIKMKTDRRECETYGYVESNEPNIFSPESGTNISVVCPDPYFYSTSTDVIIFAGVEPGFEFPFGEEEYFETGIIRKDTLRRFWYSGDADVGMVMTLQILDNDVTNIRIYNVETRQKLTIDTTKLNNMLDSPLDKGDTIVIDTNRGVKTVTMLRDGVTKNILNALAMDSDWITVSKGENTIAYEADTGVLNILFKMETKILYEGV